jgi:hypothetical protein
VVEVELEFVLEEEEDGDEGGKGGDFGGSYPSSELS